MILPRTDKDGMPYISYSQIKLWNEAKGFNTGLPGKQEFIRSYFLGEEYPDKGGFGTFGEDVETYITKREGSEKFTDLERKTLDAVVPIGVFQREIKIPFDGFYVLGYIDDTNKTLTRIRDYKTASENSMKKYELDDYFQLDVYALAALKEKGKIPKEMEVVVIERLGNGFKGGRAVMTVGANMWIIPRTTNDERLNKLEEYIVTTAKEISQYYEIFLKLNT